jgi:microsomal epoxide hydrolase
MLKFVSHYAVHVLDPQTLAYALADSPVGTLAWLLERWRNWGGGRGAPERVYTREHMIANAMLYWATGTIGSSLRAYADAAHDRGGHPMTGSRVWRRRPRSPSSGARIRPA